MKASRAFTLVELMVVISIISMLASVVLAAIRPMRAQARDTVRKQEVHQLDTAVQQYISDKGHPPEWVGCRAQINILNSGNVSGCVAVSTSGFDADGNPVGNDAWTSFTNEIKPYMPTVPKDPCVGASSCTMTDGTVLGYTYMPPAAVYYYSGNSSSNYQLSVALETGSSTGGTTGNSIPADGGPFRIIWVNATPNPAPSLGPIVFAWRTSDPSASCGFQQYDLGNNWPDITSTDKLHDLAGQWSGTDSVSVSISPSFSYWQGIAVRLHCIDQHGTEANNGMLFITNADYRVGYITSYTASRAQNGDISMTWTSNMSSCKTFKNIPGIMPTYFAQNLPPNGSATYYQSDSNNDPIAAVGIDCTNNPGNFDEKNIALSPRSGDILPPSVPTNVVATRTGNSMTVRWQASTDTGGSGLAGYRIYLNGTSLTQVGPSITSYLDVYAPSTPPVQYCFSIAAYDNAGNSSAQSLQGCAI